MTENTRLAEIMEARPRNALVWLEVGRTHFMLMQVSRSHLEAMKVRRAGQVYARPYAFVLDQFGFEEWPPWQEGGGVFHVDMTGGERPLIRN